MIQVNLLPPEVRERVKSRRVTLAVAAGAGVALVLLAFVFVLQSSRLSSAKQQLAVQQSANAALQTKVDGLQRYRLLAQRVADARALVTEITGHQIMWSGALRDLSMVIPTDVFLTQLAGTLQPAGTTTMAPGATPATTIVGNITFTGSALDQPALALWLERLEKVDGWVNPWVSTDTSSPPVVNFAGTVDITQAATSEARQP
jgi:Tfp pilus assembly protein PilN